MSVQAISWAMRQDVRPAGRKLTLVALARHAKQGGWCCPSQQELASDTSQSVSTIHRHLTRLADGGLIEKEHRYREGGSRMNDGYKLLHGGDITIPLKMSGYIPVKLKGMVGSDTYKLLHGRDISIPVKTKGPPVKLTGMPDKGGDYIEGGSYLPGFAPPSRGKKHREGSAVDVPLRSTSTPALSRKNKANENGRPKKLEPEDLNSAVHRLMLILVRVGLLLEDEDVTGNVYSKQAAVLKRLIGEQGEDVTERAIRGLRNHAWYNDLGEHRPYDAFQVEKHFGKALSCYTNSHAGKTLERQRRREREIEEQRQQDEREYEQTVEQWRQRIDDQLRSLPAGQKGATIAELKAEAKRGVPMLDGKASTPAIAEKRKRVLVATIRKLYGERVGDERPEREAVGV